MRLIAFVIVACCFLYLYKEYSDAVLYRKFKTKKFFSLRKVRIVYLKYNKIQNNFYVEAEEGKTLFYGTYRQCLKYLKTETYEEEI